MYHAKTKAHARQLRSAGLSLDKIACRLNISKSTASLWLRDEPRPIFERKLSGEMKLARGEESHLRAVARMERWQAEAETLWAELSKDPLFTLGLGLYWGEGGKTHKVLTICNNDPELIKIWVKWCKKVLPHVEQTIRVYAHMDVDEDRAILFWKRVTGYTAALKVVRMNTRKNKEEPTRIAINGTCKIVAGKGCAEYFVKTMYWINKLKQAW